MSNVTRYDPYREAVSLRNAVDQLFSQSFVYPSIFGTRSEGASGWQTPMDVFETEHGYQVRLLLPGVKPEDIELTAHQNTLTIKGQVHAQQREEKQGNWLVKEIGSGSFERSVTFAKPIVADGIETVYENGLLSIQVPVSEASKPKKISITQGQKASEIEAQTR